MPPVIRMTLNLKGQIRGAHGFLPTNFVLTNQRHGKLDSYLGVIGLNDG